MARPIIYLLMTVITKVYRFGIVVVNLAQIVLKASAFLTLYIMHYIVSQEIGRIQGKNFLADELLTQKK